MDGSNGDLRTVLMQSVAYLQGNMNVNDKLLGALLAAQAISKEESSTILKESLPSGRVMGLVWLLRNKGAGAHSALVEALEQHECEAAASFLASRLNTDPLNGRRQSIIGKSGHDPRVKHYLKTRLGDSVEEAVLDDLSSKLITREVHNDELEEMKEKCNVNARQEVNFGSGGAGGRIGAKPMSPLTFSEQSSTCGSDSPEQSPAITTGGLSWAENEFLTETVATLESQNKTLQADLDIMRQEYDRMLQHRFFLLEAMRQFGASQLPDRLAESQQKCTKLEEEIKVKDDEILELKFEIELKDDEIRDAREELHEAIRRERKCKRALGLNADASEDDIERRIEEMGRETLPSKRALVEELQSERRNKAILKRKLDKIQREKEYAEQRLRNKVLHSKSMKQEVDTKRVFETMKGQLPQEFINQLELGMEISAPSLVTLKYDPDLRRAGRLYCVICREVFELGVGRPCLYHHEPYRGQKWMCCKDDRTQTGGCLRTPHVYIIKTSTKFLLTDGFNFMEIKRC